MQNSKVHLIYGLLAILSFLYPQFVEANENNIVQGIVKTSANKAKDQEPLPGVLVKIWSINGGWNDHTETEKKEEEKGRYSIEVPIRLKNEKLVTSYSKDGYITHERDSFLSNLAEKELDSVALDKERKDGKYEADELIRMAESVKNMMVTGVYSEFIKGNYIQIVTQMNRADPDEKAKAVKLAQRVFSYIDWKKTKGDICVDAKYVGKCFFPEGFDKTTLQ